MVRKVAERIAGAWRGPGAGAGGKAPAGGLCPPNFKRKIV